MVRNAIVILFILMSVKPSYGFWDLLLNPQLISNTVKWIKGEPVNLDPATQYMDMVSIQKEANNYLSSIDKNQKQSAEDAKQTNKYIQKLNDISSYMAEQTQLISEQTNIKLSSTEEAFEFFTNKDKAKEKTLEGILNRDFFKQNPEYANGLEKVMNGYDLNTSDLVGILDVIVLGNDSDMLIIRRLQRRGYSRNQIERIIKKVKEIRLLQQEIADDNSILLENIATLERYKQTKNKTNCNKLKQDQQKNDCLQNLYAMDSNMVEQTRIIMDLKKQINEKIAKNDALLAYIRNYEIHIDNQNYQKQKMSDEKYLFYLSQKNKGESAQEKLDDFVNYASFQIGRGY